MTDVYGRRLQKPPALPDLELLASAANRVLERWPQATKATEKDPEAIAGRIRRRVVDADWRGATVAEVVRSARVVFDDGFRTRRTMRQVRSFYYAEIRASTKRSFLDAMMSVYLSSYEPGTPHTNKLASALGEAKGSIGAAWTRLRGEFPKFLEPRSAHKSIAWRMRQMADPWTELQDAGIQDPHGPGMMYHAHLAYVGYMAERLGTWHGIDHLVRWLKPEGRPARTAGAVEAIEALLSPWLQRDPQEKLREHLVEQLQSLYGDPRVVRGSAWDTVNSEHRQVMDRWITGVNIRFFLDVVSTVETSHMWEPRREFWLGLYEKDRIDAAWVAFSPDAQREASEQSRRHGGRGLAFGEQTAGGGRSNTSLLILRIGNCIVVEGSHNYKVHVFRTSNRHAPKLFQRQYDCERIRHIPGAEAQAHHVNWERRVYELIEYHS